MTPQAIALRTATFLAWTVLLICAAILVIGYGAGYERFLRPWPGSPSTHPFTALALALLASGILLRPYFGKSGLSITCYAAALSIGACRIVEVLFGWHIPQGVALFHETLLRYQQSGSPITLGVNTAAAVAVAAAAGLSQAFARPNHQQMIATVALTPALVSFVGYSYNMHDFHGAMSIYTTLLLIAACAGILLSTAHRAYVSMILSKFVAGKLARRLLVAVALLPFAIGFLIVQTAPDSSDGPLAVLIVCLAVGDVALVLSVLMTVERIDRKRRELERTNALGATHDSLTGLSNRRFFDAAAAREFERSRRSGSALGVVVLDIDHFKDVNDKFGHQIGDEVLTEVGRILSRACRSTDVVSRLGGEEFAALLPQTNLDGAFQWAERVRLAISSASFSDQSGGPLSVTISAGVTEFSTTDSGIDAVVNKADRALYAAKAGGRNRASIDTDSATPSHPTGVLKLA